jgi:hypothetical protein
MAMNKKIQMKKNRFLIYAILVIALCVIQSCSLVKNNDDNTNFAIADTSAIKKIFIADKANHRITLVREKHGWKVNAKYAVRTDAIALLLQALHDLKVNRPASINEHNNIVKEMAASAIKVEIFDDADKKMQVYYVGLPGKNYQGNYFLMENSNQPYLVEIPGFDGELSARFFVGEDDWRTRNIMQLKPADIKTVSVIYFDERKNESYSIASLNLNEYKIMPNNNDKPSTKKCFDLFNSFRNLSVLAYTLNIPETDSFKALSPFALIEIITTDNKKNQIELVHGLLSKRSKQQFDEAGIPKKFDDENHFAWINNRSEFVKIQNFALRNILQPKSYFLSNDAK